MMPDRSPDNEEEDEWEGLFKFGDSEDDSDEEYYSLLQQDGKILKSAEFPYDKNMRIMQANRELFSQPNNMRKKPTSRVRFNLVPRLISFNESGEVTGERPGEESPLQPRRRRETYLRRMTPVTIPPYMLPSVSTPQANNPPSQTVPRPSMSPKKDPPKNTNGKLP